jgi:hypothetical protein
MKITPLVVSFYAHTRTRTHVDRVIMAESRAGITLSGLQACEPRSSNAKILSFSFLNPPHPTLPPSPIPIRFIPMEGDPVQLRGSVRRIPMVLRVRVEASNRRRVRSLRKRFGNRKGKDVCASIPQERNQKETDRETRAMRRAIARGLTKVSPK